MSTLPSNSGRRCHKVGDGSKGLQGEDARSEAHGDRTDGTLEGDGTSHVLD